MSQLPSRSSSRIWPVLPLRVPRPAVRYLLSAAHRSCHRNIRPVFAVLCLASEKLIGRPSGPPFVWFRSIDAPRPEALQKLATCRSSLVQEQVYRSAVGRRRYCRQSYCIPAGCRLTGAIGYSSRRAAHPITSKPRARQLRECQARRGTSRASERSCRYCACNCPARTRSCATRTSS